MLKGENELSITNKKVPQVKEGLHPLHISTKILV